MVEGIQQYQKFTHLLGQVITLAVISKTHRHWSLADFDRLIVPPIALGQCYAFWSDTGVLTGFFTWANLTKEAEFGYLERIRLLVPSDWNAGDHSKIWMIDAFAPYGGLLRMTKFITKDLRERAEAGGWPAKRAAWARSHGTGHVQHIGEVRR